MAKLDQHYYMLLDALRFCGWTENAALGVAWASGYTDFHVSDHFRTQCIKIEALVMEVQRTVIIPFHALPGDNPQEPYIVTFDSRLARKLINTAKTPLELGAAYHSYVDTSTHRGFSGWNEKNNSKPGLIPLLIPNILHSDYGNDPDDLDAEWERDGVKVNNKAKALECFQSIVARLGGDVEAYTKHIRPILAVKGYENRKDALMDSCGIHVRYQDACRLYKDDVPEFERAALKQQSIVLEYISQF